MSWIVLNLQSGHAYIVEMIMFNVQRAITPKVGKPGLQFMCFARRFIVFCICVKFPENILNSFQLTVCTQVHGRNDFVHCSKDNNSKRSKPELQFMYSACHPHGACVCEVG